MTEYDPETGLPIHIEFPLTADGQGPARPAETATIGCWCPAGADCDKVPTMTPEEFWGEWWGEP